MIRCPRCQQENPPQSKFCLECATPPALRCANCGTHLPAGARWGSKTIYSQVRLDSLPAESAAELLAALLGPDPGLASLTQMLVKRGNPFFLEETVRTLVETGALAGERGAYRLTRPVEALQVPVTVLTIPPSVLLRADQVIE
jgi:hypothetical protein